MSNAEFRVMREMLGLPTEWLTGYLGVSLRSVRRWDAGELEAPDGVMDAMDALESVAVERINQLIAEASNASEPHLYTFRRDEDYAGGGVHNALTGPDGVIILPASWHRALVGRAAAMVPGVEISYK